MHEVVEESESARRVGVERGIYRQANGKYVTREGLVLALPRSAWIPGA